METVARPTNKGWEDDPLPLLDGEEFTSTKRVTKPRSETSETVKYTRVKAAARPNCEDCTTHQLAGEQRSISQSSYVRSDPTGSIHLCYLHTNERRHRDQLDRKI